MYRNLRSFWHLMRYCFWVPFLSSIPSYPPQRLAPISWPVKQLLAFNRIVKPVRSTRCSQGARLVGPVGTLPAYELGMRLLYALHFITTVTKSRPRHPPCPPHAKEETVKRISTKIVAVCCPSARITQPVSPPNRRGTVEKSFAATASDHDAEARCASQSPCTATDSRGVA